jgi:restriction system protein
MPKEWDLDYNLETGILVVEYGLPSLDQLSRTSEVRYVQSRDEFTEKVLSDAQLRALYDAVVYQIVLRTVHELLEADTVGALEAVVFNGRVTSVNPRTGHETTACILSLQASKTEFLAINLAQVDPKACFKALKGVGSSKLHSLTPVAPIVQVRRDDGRFVSAREVASTLDDSVNLAAMDWEDFEHLVRELFEHEFTASGGEVKVTQASRDGGVDAIAFDPDPIRGGKIVIQAKRYTNTVGVAAVRDLYGTVMNEGATKGILVTTSDYGPDAYAFAKDKPLTLLNGANLLHLLGKHGTRAKIDIQEARRLMGL